jgi:hypothetical protein
MSKATDYIATATITDPAAVQARCAAKGWIAHKGAIFCNIPEAGFLGGDMVYCRYALSIPYIRIQTNWKVLVHPTVISETDDPERWVYTGIVDCGTDSISVGISDQLLVQLLNQVIYASTSSLYLGSKTATEALVLGNKFKTELDKHKKLMQDLQTALNVDWVTGSMDGGALLKTNIKAALTTFLADPLPDYSSILSTKVFTE